MLHTNSGFFSKSKVVPKKNSPCDLEHVKMADGWGKVRKEVTCAICLGIYKKPKMLPCLHTFCAKCLQGLWQQSLVTPPHFYNSQPPPSSRIIGCPVCREQVQLTTVEDLPSNFSASHLVDIVEMQERVSKEAPPTCQSCKARRDAVASCAPCGIFLCGSCLEVHKTLKLTSSHHINSLDDIKSGKVTVPSILDHKQEYCSTHPDKPLELYCKKEDTLICLGCAVVKHRDHQYDFISQVAKEHKQQIRSGLTNVKQQLKSLQRAVAEVKTTMEQVQRKKEENIQNIEKAFQKVVLALRMRKRQLIYDVDQITSYKMGALNIQCTELTNSCAQMNNYIELINAKLTSESDRAIVAMRNQLIERGNQLSSSVKGTRLSPMESIPPDVKFYGLQALVNRLQQVGEPLDVCIKRCQLTKTSTQNLHKFEVIVKDAKGQPVTDCMDALNVKVFPNERHDTQEQVNIVHEGNGRYTFSAKKCNSCSTANRHYWHADCGCRKYGSVNVQICDENVPGSPLR